MSELRTSGADSAHHGPDRRGQDRSRAAPRRAGIPSRSSASIRRWSIAAWTSARANRRAKNWNVSRITWSIFSIRRNRTRRDSSCATRCRQLETFASEASCRCWSAARCCTSVLCAGALRKCRKPIRKCDRKLTPKPRARAGRRYMRSSRAIDPLTAQRIQPNDGQRIQRALEVHRLTGRTLSELHAQTRPADPAMKFAAFAWAPSDRERLYQAIERRFEQMMQAGLLDEVRQLKERGDLHAELPAIRSVGYRQLWEHLCGNESLTASVQRAIFATRQLARRQLIWLRAEDDVQWCDALDSTAAGPIENAVATLFEASCDKRR